MKELIQQVNFKNFDHTQYNNLKKNKDRLSNQDKRELDKIFIKAKELPREKVLSAIVCYAVWNPDEAIEKARKKGVFRYRISGQKTANNGKYYLDFLEKHADLFGFSDYIKKYLITKINSHWLEDFYQKTEKKIDQLMEDHHKKRLRKRINGHSMESALHKELLAFIDMLFFLVPKNQTEQNQNSLSGFSKEDIAEGVSYLLFRFLDRIGISEKTLYFTDTHFVRSNQMEQLILLACQLNYMLEIELLIDFYDYEVVLDGNQITIRSFDDSFEKSIRLAYVKTQLQEFLFYNKIAAETKDGLYLKEMADFVVSELGDRVIQRNYDGILSRYCFVIPTEILEKIAERDAHGNAMFYVEELTEIAFFAKEMCMTVDELSQRKITEHCSLSDIVLCQRFFRFMYYIQQHIFDTLKENEIDVLLQSMVPITKRDFLLAFFSIVLNDRKKAEELFQLMEYDVKYKFDIQYTPFLTFGDNVIYPMSVVVHSNLLRNTIAYSYLSGNKIVNDDGGMEPLVKRCEEFFQQCSYGYHVFSNMRYSYAGKKGEIDLIIVSDTDVLLIECKAPLMPTSTYELRATFEQFEKASYQLDQSKAAFEDDGFRNKYFRDCLKLDGRNKKIRTCIIMGNRMFSTWSGSKHPVRYAYELDMILTHGQIHSTAGSWRIWKHETYSHEDLIDYLDQNGRFTTLMKSAMKKYSAKMNFQGKTLIYERFLLDCNELFSLCEKMLPYIEKT